MDEMDRRKRLRSSIVATTGTYLALQFAIFAAFAVPSGFLGRYGIEFAFTVVLFHGFLLAMMLLFEADFIKEATGEKLARMNLANRITLIRVSTLPTLLFLVIAAREFRIRAPLLILVVLVFATDFIDGYVSRKAGEVTRAGRMMDSASDYCLLVVLTLVFHYYRLIPTWFFWLVIGRLGSQVLMMAILIFVKKRIDPKSTFMGKAAVASIMVLYCLDVLDLILVRAVPRVLITGMEIAVGVVILASVVDKVLAFRSALAKPGAEPRRVDDGDDKKRP